MFAYSMAKAMDDATDGGSWEMYARRSRRRAATAFTAWGLEAKVLAAGLASRVSDEMLHLCGGRGYMRANEIERLVRDAKAGWVMAPSNEVSRQIVGRWALLGADSVDWWNQQVDERALRNELGKLDDDGKRSDRRSSRPSSRRDLTGGKMEIVLPPKSDHATYDPPRARAPRDAPGARRAASPTTSASGSSSSRTCGSGRCSST